MPASSPDNAQLLIGPTARAYPVSRRSGRSPFATFGWTRQRRPGAPTPSVAVVRDLDDVKTAWDCQPRFRCQPGGLYHPVLLTRPGRVSVATHCPDGAGARRVRSKSPSDAPAPGAAVILSMLRGSPQCEHTATALTKCPHAVCFIVSGAPLGAAHWSPHWRMAVTTCHRSRPLSVRRYSERGG
jgi:hypothetical protein